MRICQWLELRRWVGGGAGVGVARICESLGARVRRGGELRSVVYRCMPSDTWGESFLGGVDVEFGMSPKVWLKSCVCTYFLAELLEVSRMMTIAWRQLARACAIFLKRFFFQSLLLAACCDMDSSGSKGW